MRLRRKVISIGLFGALFYRYYSQKSLVKYSGIAEIDQMSGKQFEQYLGQLFKAQGYSVKFKQDSGDFGADLVLMKDGRRVVVQAKRYQKRVGIKVVQEVQAAIAHYGASEGWGVSNSDFTEAAYSLAKSNGVRLINRNVLMNMIVQAKGS
jgi:restriction system protein